MRLIGSLLAMAIGVLILLAAYWVFLSYTIDQPYHEIWIDLNSRLPEPMRAWSCHTVFARVSAGIAPYGCDGLWK